MRGALAVGLVLVLGGAVRAQQPAPADPLAEGRRRFALADQELNLGHYEKALEHLEASYRLTGKAALLYNLGYVNKQLFARTRKLEHLTTAIDLFKTYLDNARSATEPKVIEQRGRAEKELKSAEDDLAREQAARVKGEEALALGEDFLQKGRLDEAREQLARYVRTPGNERPGVTRALQLKAAIAGAAGESAAAADAYARALLLDRSIALPHGAPDAARRAFTQAQLRVGSTPVLTVSHTPPGSLKPGASVDLTFEPSPDPLRLIHGVLLRYRAGSGAFSSLAPQPPGKITLPRVFSGALLPGAKIEYYVDVLDADGAILQHLGSVSLPFSVELERPAPRSIARKWWFWTATVAAVAAVAVGVGVGVALNEPPRTQLNIFTGLSQK